MGDVCNGKYEIYQYLVDAYKFHPYKSVTTKNNKIKTKFDAFEYLDLNEMLQQEKLGEIICLKQIRGYHFGKKISSLPNGFSTCIIDYMGYLELSKIFNTVPILINRSRLKRFNLEDCNVKAPTEFLAYENLNRKQYEFALNDGNVTVLKPRNMIDLKLQIDKVLEIYLDDISYDVDLDYKV
jgi:hypothetical protein